VISTTSTNIIACVQSLAPSKNVVPQLTSEQKGVICDLNDSGVNTTESHICDKPVTIPSSFPALSIAKENVRGGAREQVLSSRKLPHRKQLQKIKNISFLIIMQV
jgi:hypothetical protein